MTEKMFIVDVPPAMGEEWETVKYFDTKEEAVKFCQHTYGADEEGRINLITEVEE